MRQHAKRTPDPATPPKQAVMVPSPPLAAHRVGTGPKASRTSRSPVSSLRQDQASGGAERDGIYRRAPASGCLSAVSGRRSPAARSALCRRTYHQIAIMRPMTTSPAMM